MMNPSLGKNLIDVACGTGDIGKLYLDSTSKNNKITCVDPNKGMVGEGKQKLSSYKNINWVISSAEKLPFEDNKFDFYTISFGLRNTKNLNKALSEAYRVLRPGGVFYFYEHVVSNKKFGHFVQKSLNPMWKLGTTGCHLDRDIKKTIDQR